MDESNPKKEGMTIWMTGLSGAGKTTLAQAVASKLRGDYDFKCKILDGDIIRKGLNRDLGFSKEDREENLRRIAEVAKLFTEEGYFTIVAFITPLQKSRDDARYIHALSGLPFKLVYISTSLEVCEARDTKGLYKKARHGQIPEFTGISSPFQKPETYDIEINTEDLSIEDSVSKIFSSLWPVEKMEGNKIKINQTSRQWLKVLKEGWAGPELNNFMNEQQLSECIHFRRVTLSNKQFPLTIPILCLPEEPISYQQPDQIEFVYEGFSLAKLKHPKVFSINVKEIASKVFGTESLFHPGVKHHFFDSVGRPYTQALTGDALEINPTILQTKLWPGDNPSLYISKNMTLEQIQILKPDALILFQVRNPLHNGHVKLLNDAQNSLKKQGFLKPVILLHPLGGWTKDDDVPLSCRLQQHRVLIEEGVLQNTVLGVWPSPMFYAGPIEVIWHLAS